MVRPAAKREAVALLQSMFEMSERRACTVIAADRKMVRYRSRRPADAELRARLRELANQRRRFGYRRLFILLRREGEPSGINRIYRLYREEGLIVRKRRGRRKAIGTRAPMRDELLNESLFFGLADARLAIKAWVADYNNSRPHSSLDYTTPAAFAAYLTATCHRAALLDGSALRPVAQPAPEGVSTAEALIAAG